MSLVVGNDALVWSCGGELAVLTAVLRCISHSSFYHTVLKASTVASLIGKLALYFSAVLPQSPHGIELGGEVKRLVL